MKRRPGLSSSPSSEAEVGSEGDALESGQSSSSRCDVRSDVLESPSTWRSWLLCGPAGRTRTFALLLVCACGLLILVSSTASSSVPWGSSSASASPPFTEEQAREYNQLLENRTLEEVLRWAVEAFPGQVVQFSSFGPSGMVIIDKLASMGLLKEMPVAMIDTLHLFTETYQHVRNVSKRYPAMKLREYYPKGYTAEQGFKFDILHGDDMWTDDFNSYSYLTKVEPTARALQELNPRAWITGRRRSQGAERSSLPVVELDDGRLKINPMASWTLEQVWQYLREHRVPYNVMHDRGYASIGDHMNTRPVKGGEGERAGRFQYSGKQTTECGMHTHLQRAKAMMEAAKAEKKVMKLPHLECGPCVDLTPDTFEELVLTSKKAVLVEFYSPICGHCQHFAPEYAKVAQKLTAKQRVVVARMDALSHKVPQAGKEAGFDVGGYPGLFLAHHDPSGKLQVKEFPGRKDAQHLLEWLAKELGEPLDNLAG